MTCSNSPPVSQTCCLVLECRFFWCKGQGWAPQKCPWSELISKKPAHTLYLLSVFVTHESLQETLNTLCPLNSTFSIVASICIGSLCLRKLISTLYNIFQQQIYKAYKRWIFFIKSHVCFNLY